MEMSIGESMFNSRPLKKLLLEQIQPHCHPLGRWEKVGIEQATFCCLTASPLLESELLKITLIIFVFHRLSDLSLVFQVGFFFAT